MEIAEKFGKEIHSVLKANQLKMMEVSGLDIKRLESVQAETTSKMTEVAKRIGVGFREGSQVIAENHRKALLTHYKLRHIPYYPYPYLDCGPPLEEAMDCSKTIELWPSDDPSHVKGDCTCDVAENICRPYLELHGLGNGVPVSGTVTCGLVFCFRDVPRSGRYSIRALTQANGYRLLQRWGCGPCGNSEPTTGHLKVTVRLCVIQPFEDWGHEYILVDTTTGGPPAAIDLNRYVYHNVDLREGYDAFIKVEFKIDAAIDGCGQCYVDLQTSDFFYFRVPEIMPCRYAFPSLWDMVRSRNIPAEAVLELMKKYGLDIGPPKL